LLKIVCVISLVSFICIFCRTVRHSWQKLGTEFSKLADLHSQKATAYLEAVRKPLQELLPQLEETRQEVRPTALSDLTWPAPQVLVVLEHYDI
jgi:hypothetical protein